jgi:ubiquinol-cytochrome c reductase cytochrome b subunit
VERAAHVITRSPSLRKALRYVFPEHWSFLVGEITVFAFIVLVGTGIFLALFFEPSLGTTRYDGPFEPLRGAVISRAYDSTLALSFEIPAGLLMRQTHHWAALVFVVAITLHTLRIFFTGAYRSPRILNHYTGVVLLTLALLLGFTGYSLPDDLLSGMGLAIGYSTALSIPVGGGDIGSLVWGGEYPGSDVFESRLYAAHIFILPALTASLIAAHLALVIRQKHTQFPGRGRTEHNVVGAPLWAGQALRSGGLFFATATVLFLLGGLVQINPVWHWGPYEPHLASNGAQPDWYLGWLIGALRLTPNWEPTIGGFTLAGNPFFGGLLYPGIVFGLLFLWPNLERAVTKDRRRHHLLDRPRDAPRRTAIGAAALVNVIVVFVAGASDRVLVEFGFDYVTQIRVFQVLIFAGPILAYAVTKRICEELRQREADTLAPRSGHFVRRLDDGSFIVLPTPAQEDGGQPAAAAVRGTDGTGGPG